MRGWRAPNGGRWLDPTQERQGTETTRVGVSMSGGSPQGGRRRGYDQVEAFARPWKRRMSPSTRGRGACQRRGDGDHTRRSSRGCSRAEANETLLKEAGHSLRVAYGD